MDFTAKDATILNLIASRPTTELFDRLVAELEQDKAKELAKRIRQRAKPNAVSSLSPSVLR